MCLVTSILLIFISSLAVVMETIMSFYKLCSNILTSTESVTVTVTVAMDVDTG